MSKLEVVKFLLQEIEDEYSLFKRLKEAERSAKERSEKECLNYWTCFKWEGRFPVKSRIKNNAIKIRQLLIGIEKEIEI